MDGTELLGYSAAVLVVASLLFQSVVLGRAATALGACLWIVYGVLVGSGPVVAFNAALICVQIARLSGFREKRIDEMAKKSRFKVPVLK